MKILFPVLHYYPVIGGLEVWTQNIAEGLSGDFQVFVVTGRVKGELKNERKERVKIFRTSLCALEDLSFSSPFYIFTALPFIFFKSLSLVKNKQIDICHCQGFLSGFLGYIFLKIYNLPYIVTVQKLEKGRGFLRKLVYQNAKICIVASSAIKEDFREIGVKNIEVIPNGIDLQKFKKLKRKNSREKLGIRNQFIIMAIGRLEKRKGFQYLIEALKLLQRKDSFKFQLLIIGDGILRKKLEDLTKDLNLQEKARFLGQVPSQEIPHYLAAADCFVLPSLEEGFGIVILEAMAAEVPVVATKVGGILDIVEDKKTGILIEPQNSKEIAEAIYKVHSNPRLSGDLVKNSLFKLQDYGWREIIERVEEVYLKTISLPKFYEK